MNKKIIEFFNEKGFFFVLSSTTHRYMSFKEDGGVSQQYNFPYFYLVGQGEIDGVKVGVVKHKFFNAPSFFEEFKKAFNDSSTEAELLKLTLEREILTDSFEPFKSYFIDFVDSKISEGVSLEDAIYLYISKNVGVSYEYLGNGISDVSLFNEFGETLIETKVENMTMEVIKYYCEGPNGIVDTFADSIYDHFLKRYQQ